MVFLTKVSAWLPRLSSYKFLNNFRSGGFAIPSVMDSYLSYCEDTVLDNRVTDISPVPSPTNLKLNFLGVMVFLILLVLTVSSIISLLRVYISWWFY